MCGGGELKSDRATLIRKKSWKRSEGDIQANYERRREQPVVFLHNSRHCKNFISNLSHRFALYVLRGRILMYQTNHYRHRCIIFQ